MSQKGVFFLGFLAFLGVVVYAATRKPKEPVERMPQTPVEWVRLERPEAAPTSTLKNKAKWKVKYNDEGRITEVEVERDVKLQ